MNIIRILVTIGILVVLSSCDNQRITTKSLNSDIDTVSYAIGLDMAYKLKQSFPEIDEDILIQGFMNGIDSTDILIDKVNIDKIMNLYFQKRQVEQQEKRKAETLEKIEKEFMDVKNEGIKFLETNKSKAGVQTTESGLQYIVLKEGSGEKPKATSKVKVHYHGTSINGNVFDSSVDRGEPSEFFVYQVIKGWTEGLQLMSVGSKYKFFIPQELAYGAFPRQDSSIKPLEALIFEVELLEIVE